MQRAQVIPLQDNQQSEAVASAARAQERARKAANPSEDGDSKEFSVSIPGSSSRVIVHGLGRVPRGWAMLSAESGAGASVYEDRSERNNKTITLTNPTAVFTAVVRIRVY